MTIKHLPLPKSGSISEIIHCSDIHIRRGDSLRSRKEEYLQVFNNFFEQLKNTPSIQNKSAVIICTGDIFHDYENLHPNTLDVFNYFVDGLTSFAPTYLIQGNHDFKSTQANETDSIASCIHVHRENLVYLDKTGLYQAGDTIFGLVAEHDIIDPCSTSGKQVSELPNFPADFPPDIRHKIALFHGTIRNCTLQNYQQDKIGYPLEWFQGYNVVLLGHIHLQQIQNVHLVQNTNVYKWNNNTIPWGYPGSLIQQNLGENIHGHGYLTWNLQNKTVTKHHVYNPIGKMYLKYNNSTESWQACLNHKWTDLETTLNVPLIPKEMLILTIKDRYPTSSLNQLETTLNREVGQNNYRITNLLQPGSQEIDQYDIEFEHTHSDTLAGDIEELNSTQTFLNYLYQHSNNLPPKFSQLINQPELLLIDENTVPDHIKELTVSKNSTMKKNIALLKECVSKLDLRYNKEPLHLIHLQWDWILSYGPNNWYDFTKLDGCIGLVNGPNDAGKSSLMEIICFALFGGQLPSRMETKNSNDIISFQKPHGVCANTQIQFQLADKLYLLYRKFTPNKKGDIQKNRELYCLESASNTFCLIRSETAVETWIYENIGNTETFLLSCMVTQNLDQDFFSKNSNEQHSILDNSLNLEYIPKLLELLRVARNSYSAILENLKISHKLRSNTQPVIDEAKILSLQQEQANIQQEVHNLTKTNKILDVRINQIPSELKSILTQPLESLKTYLRDLKHTKNNLILPTFTKEEITEQLSLVKINLNTLSPYIDKSLGQDSADLETLISNLPQESKPDSNETTINKEIALFKNRYNLGEMDQQSTALANHQKNLEQIQNKVQRLRQDLEKHQKQFPKRPSQSKSTYNQWLKNNRSFQTTTKSELNKLEKYCLENPLQKPTTDITLIENIQKSIELTTKNLQKPTWATCSEETFKHESNQISFKYSQLKVKLDLLKEQLDTYQMNIDTLKNKISVDANKLQSIPYTSPPTITEEQIESWFNKFTNAELSAPKYQTILEIHQKIESVQHEFNTLQPVYENLKLQAKDRPFNPECWACQKAEWKVNLDRIQEKLTENQNSLKLLQQQLTQFGEPFDKKIVTDNLKSYENMRSEKHLYKSYQERHLLHQTYLDQVTPIKQKIGQNTTLLNQQESEKKSLSQEIKNLESEITNLLPTYNEIELCKNNRSNWQANISLVEKEKELHRRYNRDFENHCKYRQISQYFNEKSNWEEELTIISEFETWNNKLEQLRQEILTNETQYSATKQLVDKITQYVNDKEIYLNNLEESAKWSRWYNNQFLHKRYEATFNYYQKLEFEEELEVLNYNEKLNQDINNYQKLIEVKPYFDQYNGNVTILETYLQKLELLGQELLKWTVLKEQANQIKNDCQNILDTVQIFSQELNWINIVSQLTTDYKFWIYKNKLTPRIISNVNKIAHMLNRGQEYTLDVDLTLTKHGEQQNIQYKWYISDGINRARIQRNGGFRHFLFGLAMRITLSYLGANSVRCQQLFLDEGFVGADQDNLEMVPHLIRKFMQLYRSILVVSHLPILKENIDINTTISRANKISQLQFGEHISYKLKKTPNTINTQQNDLISEQPLSPIGAASNSNISQTSGFPINPMTFNQIIFPNRCHRMTKTGTQCSRNPINSTQFCKIHQT